MSLDEIRATRDIVLQTEETKSNFSGSGKTVYICEVVRPCDYQKETDTAADKLAAEIERVNADNRALRRKVERLDYGETCECVKEAEQEERVRNAENQKDQNRQVQNRGVLDRKAG
jgi:hypothetical protein